MKTLFELTPPAPPFKSNIRWEELFRITSFLEKRGIFGNPTFLKGDAGGLQISIYPFNYSCKIFEDFSI
jgi:hypothetical protein